MEGTTIHYQVDLVIQLIDTTTGKSIGGRRSVFTKNGRTLETVSRGGGNYVVINADREDFTLGIDVFGYEKSTLKVHYEELDERLPIQMVFLIPKENVGVGEPVLSLTGILDGIESIEGVNVNRPVCSISDFNEKKMEMSVFRPQGVLSQGILNMEDRFYGLIKERTSFERIEVIKKTGESKVKLKENLKNEFKVNAPITRVLFGKVEGNNYTFRVRDDASILEFLIRYVVKGEERFALVNFHEPLTLKLM